jgi:hypothetical protein
MLNAKEYAVIMNEAAINNGKVPYFTMDEINQMGNGTDWIDEMLYDNAITQNYSLGIAGGTEKNGLFHVIGIYRTGRYCRWSRLFELHRYTSVLIQITTYTTTLSRWGKI